MRTGPRSISRSASVLAASCWWPASSPPRAPRRDAVERASDRAVGFPLGTFAKEISDPDLGHVRLVWTFEPDGRYAEIPFALDGRRSWRRRSVARTRSTARPWRSPPTTRPIGERAATAGGWTATGSGPSSWTRTSPTTRTGSRPSTANRGRRTRERPADPRRRRPCRLPGDRTPLAGGGGLDRRR